MVEKTLFINGKLEKIAHKLGVDKVRFKKLAEPHPIDNSSYAIVRDPEKCINCGQCAAVCPVGLSLLRRTFSKFRRTSMTRPRPALFTWLQPFALVSVKNLASSQ